MFLHLLKNSLLPLGVAGVLTCSVAIQVHGSAANITTLASFAGSTGSGPSGAGPYAGLLLSGDGNFYGTTHQGGTNGLPFGFGTVFKLTPAGTVTTLVSFNHTNGEKPYAGLAQAADGSLFGTTLQGGTSNLGTLFRLAPNGSLTTLLSFTNGNGANPSGRLTLGRDGFFYGTTQVGGTSNLGTVFRVTTNGVLHTLASFTGANGAKPYAEVIQAIDSHLYGTTVFGGSSNYGTVFRLTTNGLLTTLLSFNGTNGLNPYGGLVQDPSGQLYGAAAYGGAAGAGSIFRITTNGVLATLYSFSGGVDGANPWAALVRGRDGTYYGTTKLGGAIVGPPRGTVFQIMTNGTFASLVAFGFNTNGASPHCTLVQDAAGYLYGTTRDLGVGLKGTAFRLDPAFAVLESSLAAGGIMQIGWDAWLGQTYQVQAKTNSLQNTWADLGSPRVATNAHMIITDSVSAPSRYYRLKQISTP
jgi:uncharacterized repeat protein (TIGR03803 family)